MRRATEPAGAHGRGFPPGGGRRGRAHHRAGTFGKPGATGGDREPARRDRTVAAAMVAKSPADGYTIMMGMFR